MKKLRCELFTSRWVPQTETSLGKKLGGKTAYRGQHVENTIQTQNSPPFASSLEGSAAEGINIATGDEGAEQAGIEVATRGGSRPSADISRACAKSAVGFGIETGERAGAFVGAGGSAALESPFEEDDGAAAMLLDGPKVGVQTADNEDTI